MPRTSGVDVGTIAWRKPEPQRLGEPPRRLRDLADLAAEPDLADHDRVGVDGAVVAGARDRERDREVGRGLGDRHPAGDARVDVVTREPDTGALLQDRDEHREPAAVERLRDPARDRRAGRGDERLHLDAQRAGSLDHRGDDRAGRAEPAIGEEQRARVVDRAAARSSVISKSPSSSVAPNRCFNARSMRSA